MKVKLLKKLRKELRISKVRHTNLDQIYYKFEAKNPDTGNWVVVMTSSHFYPCLEHYHNQLRKNFDFYLKWSNYHIDIIYP